VLEYYNGILFLTTNRPGALDEAFDSRIHLKLYYGPLSCKQTEEIWMVNIQRLRIIDAQRCEGGDDQPLHIFEEDIMNFAQRHFHQNSKTKQWWNGRQIRNAFQMASSLAYCDAKKRHDELKQSHPDAPSVRPKLDVEHFVMIQTMTDDFNKFIEETHGGKTHADRAYNASDRADHWHPTRAGNDDSVYIEYGTMPGNGGRPGPWGSPGWAQGAWSNNPHPRYAPGSRPPEVVMNFDDGIGPESPTMKSGFQNAPPSPNPSQQRQMMRGTSSYSSFAGGPINPSGDRPYGPHGGSNPNYQAGGQNNRGADFPMDFSGSSQGLGGNYPYVREGHERSEFVSHNQSQAFGHGQNEFTSRKNHSEEQDDY
jgi:hypothetical protein